MAVRIYLDTQDYSVLYKNRTDEQQRIYDFLQSKVDSKEIEIGFSYPIVSEFLQEFDSKHREDRIERARFIKKLCGENAFRYINRLNKEECFSYEGDWTPYIGSIFDLDIFRDSVLEKFKECFPAASRKQRQALKNKRGLKRLINENPGAFSTSSIDMPLSEKFLRENMLIRYITGEIPRKIAEKEFLKVITDLEVFISVWFDYARKGNLLFENIRRNGEKLKELICKIREFILEVVERKRDFKKYEKQIRKDGLISRLHEDIKKVKSNIPDIAKMANEYIDNFRKNEKAHSFPESFFDSVTAYINYHIKSDQNMKDSDIVDIMHSVYIPYCDLWRGDQDFANMLTRQSLPHCERIVPSLRELPERISALSIAVSA